MRALLAAGYVAAALLMHPASSGAVDPQPICGPLQDIAAALASEAQETLMAGGVSTDGYAYLVFATADGDTWTIVMTDHDGNACILDAGRHWREPGTGEGL